MFWEILSIFLSFFLSFFLLLCFKRFFRCPFLSFFDYRQIVSFFFIQFPSFDLSFFLSIFLSFDNYGQRISLFLSVFFSVFLSSSIAINLPLCTYSLVIFPFFVSRSSFHCNRFLSLSLSLSHTHTHTLSLSIYLSIYLFSIPFSLNITFHFSPFPLSILRFANILPPHLISKSANLFAWKHKLLANHK